MKKEVVSDEIALALKELGFDEPCLYCYFPNPNFRMGEKFDLIETTRMLPGQIKNIGKLIKDGSFKNTILAPLYQQAFRWFRNKHNLHILITYDENDFYEGIVKYTKLDDKFDTYEEAELELLKKLTEITKHK